MWMRKMFVALCTLPLLVVATTAPAQEQGIWDLGKVNCSTDVNTGTAVASLTLPFVTGSHVLYNFTIVDHWPSGSAVSRFSHWAPTVIYTPVNPHLSGGGGWNGSTYVFNAYPFGRVTTRIRIFDAETKQWLTNANGETTFAGPQTDCTFTG